jgi:hypothetical protein
MNPVNNLQTLYGWTPNFQLESKKPAPQGPNDGWIVLTREHLNPVCFWVSKNQCVKLTIVLDHRLFGDTIFKAYKLRNNTYRIVDVWLYNSSCIYAGTTFAQRSSWINEILLAFHTNIDGLSNLVCSTTTKVIVQKNIMPDVYTVKDQDGYLQVSDLKTSRFLRSKGEEFELECEKQGDVWVIQENIPNVK